MQSRFIKRTVAALAAAWVAVLAGCGGGGSGGSSNTAGSTPTDMAAALSPQAELGQLVFVDRALSASGQQSCQSCHVPSRAHGAPDNHAGQPGGKNTEADQGGRSSPSIRYLKFNTAFAVVAGTPTGGFFWDGRAASLKEQAGGPFLNPDEMANDSVEEVVARLAARPYAAQFRDLYGQDIFSRPQDAYDRLQRALQAFQQESPAFAPFSSKYDDYLRGTATLTAQEARGLALFNDSTKGNCFACHPSAKTAAGHPLFTDFSFDALGVPRNPDLKPIREAAARGETFYDLGLCQVPGFESQVKLCGAFKVPTLRNVAARGSFFHNGRFTDLRTVVRFYVTRDTNPELWYPQDALGNVDQYDDVPAIHRSNVNRTEAPYDRQRGGTPALTEAEIDDLVAFLKTLTDADVVAR